VPAYRSKGYAGLPGAADDTRAEPPWNAQVLSALNSELRHHARALSRPISSSPVSSFASSQISAVETVHSHTLAAAACRATPAYPITQIFFRVNRSRLHSPGKSPHLHQSSQCNKEPVWLLRCAQTVMLLVRLLARLSGMPVPPDSSSNSRYDTISYARMNFLAPSLPPATSHCHQANGISSSSNPSQTLTTYTTSACKSTSRTTPSSNGAST
jgi:hypothetical protein